MGEGAGYAILLVVKFNKSTLSSVLHSLVIELMLSFRIHFS